MTCCILLQSNEVKSSSHMEHQGLVNALMFLENSSVKVGTLVTDRHKQISKYMREKHPHIEHQYDVWHVSKGTLIYTTYYSVIIIATFRYQEKASNII